MRRLHHQRQAFIPSRSSPPPRIVCRIPPSTPEVSSLATTLHALAKASAVIVTGPSLPVEKPDKITALVNGVFLDVVPFPPPPSSSGAVHSSLFPVCFVMGTTADFNVNDRVRRPGPYSCLHSLADLSAEA